MLLGRRPSHMAKRPILVLLAVFGCGPALIPAPRVGPSDGPSPVVAVEVSPELAAESPPLFNIVASNPAPTDSAMLRGEVSERAFRSHRAFITRLRAGAATIGRELRRGIRERQTWSAENRNHPRRISAVPSVRELLQTYPASRSTVRLANIGLNETTSVGGFTSLGARHLVRLEPDGGGKKLVVRDHTQDHFPVVFELSLPANWRRPSPQANEEPSHQYAVTVSNQRVVLFGRGLVRSFIMDAAGQLTESRGLDLRAASVAGQFVVGDELVVISLVTAFFAHHDRGSAASSLHVALPMVTLTGDGDPITVPLIDGSRVQGDPEGTHLLAVSRCSFLLENTQACSSQAVLVAAVPDYVRQYPSRDGLMLVPHGGASYWFPWSSAEISVGAGCINAVLINGLCVEQDDAHIRWNRADGTTERQELSGQIRQLAGFGEHLVATTVHPAGESSFLSTHHIGESVSPVSILEFPHVVVFPLQVFPSGPRDGVIRAQMRPLESGAPFFNVLLSVDDLQLHVMHVTGGPIEVVGQSNSRVLVETGGELVWLERER